MGRRLADVPTMRPPALTHPSAAVFLGDCLDVLAEMPDDSVDAIVTDPPYALPGGFMGKSWDEFDGREDSAFAYWLAGLIDGEGHFAIKEHTRGTHAPAFALKMRADERGTLESIQRKLRIGSITSEAHEPNPMVKWSVQDKAGCQRLVDLLDKYPLRAKKRMDFAIWREAVCEWTDRPRGNRWTGPADNTRMAELRGRLMSGRRYVDPPWSGHEFQDWCRLWTTEALRVLKPGGHLLAFGGTRTWHRLAVAVEDAGFEVRDSIAWLYGSGFPKSLDVSKAIDKMDASAERRARALEFTAFIRESGLTAQQIDTVTGTNMGGHYTTAASQPTVATADLFDLLRPLLPEIPERIEELVRQRTVESENFKAREVVGTTTSGGAAAWTNGFRNMEGAEEFTGQTEWPVTAAHTAEAARFEGWGTALKPAFEPIVVARKPLIGTVAANVLAWGTGALNIDGTRVGGDVDTSRPQGKDIKGGQWSGDGPPSDLTTGAATGGRWPANVLLDGDAAAELDGQSGTLTSGVGRVGAGKGRADNASSIASTGTIASSYGDSGGASRFFPVFPAGPPLDTDTEASNGGPTLPTFRYQAKAPTRERPTVVAEDGTKTSHPTVKPLALMRWLVRLVTPPGGTVLDTFAGSGATIEAAIEEGFFAFGIEREESYLQLIQVRLDRVEGPEVAA